MVLMQIIHFDAGKLFELLAGRNTDDVVFVIDVHPQRNARTPKAVAADVPILGVGQPVGKALFAHIIRRPVHTCIVFEHALAQILHPHIPRVDGAVDQRRVGAFAEGIAMLDGRLVDQLAAMLERLDDRLVGIFAELAFVVRHQAGKFAVLIEWIDQRNIIARQTR